MIVEIGRSDQSPLEDAAQPDWRRDEIQQQNKALR